MARVLVFDVIETLLDLGPVREPFVRAFGSPPPIGEWFARMLHASLVATVTDAYEEFGTLGGRALQAVAARHGIDLSDEDREEIAAMLGRLPAHREVPQALEQLRSQGFPLATLTNSSGRVARMQLEGAGLADLFDEVLSVEEVRRYKPAREPYVMAAERLGVEPAEMRMVAAHDWDVWGAMRAGCRAAFVSRENVPFVVGKPPEIVGPDVAAVAEIIARTDQPAG